jgi:hypothetical protein
MYDFHIFSVLFCGTCLCFLAYQAGIGEDTVKSFNNWLDNLYT